MMLTLADMFGGMEDKKLFALLVIMIVACFFVIWMILYYINEIIHTRQKERTRREIAAYVAEGSITPDDAARMLTAGSESDAIDRLVEKVTEGEVDGDEAERIIAAIKSGMKTT